MPNRALLFGFLIIVAFLLSWPMVSHLDKQSLRMWDESRDAVNALEMLDNENWLVPHYDNKPDMWSTKPPLAIWLQVLALRMLGVSELAVRLPSALAGVGTILLLLGFGWRCLGRPTLGVTAAFILATSPGFVGEHVVRTGERDAILTLWLTIGFLAVYRWAEQDSQGGRARWIYLCAGALILAVMTKGVAGLLMLPGWIIYVAYTRRLRSLLVNPHVWIGFASFVGVLAAYYLGRESINSGYLEAVWNNEIGTRYAAALEGHRESTSFYLTKLVTERFLPWIFALPLAIIYVRRADPALRRFVTAAVIAAASYLVIISSADTKIFWYDAPMYPLLSLFIAVGLAGVQLDVRRTSTAAGRAVSGLLALSLGLALFGGAYGNILDSVQVSNKRDYAPPGSQAMRYGYFMRDNQDAGDYLVGYRGYNSHVRFYMTALNSDLQRIGSTDLEEILTPGTHVLLCEDEARELFHAMHESIVVREEAGCELVQVVRPRS